jgi:hypothetical protein
VDKAFIPLHEMVIGMAAQGDIHSEDLGIHMYIERFSIDSPIELDLGVGTDGTVAIGSVPPLYRVDTSLRPSYHQIRFSAELGEMISDG